MASFRRCGAIAVLALVAGCSSVTPVPTTVATAGMPNPEQALLQSIQHVDAEMAELGQRSTHVAQGPEAQASSALPDDLKRIVAFDWDGPLDAGVAKLAASVGYAFYTTGPLVQEPLNVAVSLPSAAVFDAFQALGQRAGSRATLELNPQAHSVKVIHHV